MKNFIPFLPLLFVLLISCKDKEPTGPEEVKPTEALAEATIGPEGGSISTNDFLITIPDGTFEEKQNVKLYLVENQEYFQDNNNTNVYKIDGIPSNFYKPIHVKIKYNEPLEDKAFLAIGFEDFIQEREETKMIFDLVDAADSSGFLCIDVLPSRFSSNSINGLNKSRYSSDIDYLPWLIAGWFRRATHKSISSEINYNAGLNNSKIILLGQFIDGIVDYFQNKELTSAFVLDNIKIIIYDDKKNEPHIDFSLPKTDKLTNAGEYLLGQTQLAPKYKININETLYNIAEEDDLRSIAAEIVYRFIRTAWLGTEKNWFDWASIYWVTHHFRKNNTVWEYKFSNSILLMHPFEGMETGQNNIPTGGLELVMGTKLSLKVAVHGVGLSPFIKFIMDNYDTDGKLLKNIFIEILKSKLEEPIPTDAIINSIITPEYVWWPGFIKDYINGNIFNITNNAFINNIPSLNEVQFNDETDTLKHFDSDYPDLSAKLCWINLNSSNIKDNKTLNFKLGPSSLNLDYVKTLVFGISDNKLTFLSEGIDFSVGSLAQYDALLACVVNSGNEPPLFGTNNIDLKISVEKNSEINLDLDINWVTVHITLSADYQNYDGPTTGYFFFDSQEFEKTGELVNKTFNVNWNETFWPVTTTCTGSIEIQLDTASTSGGYKITNFLISEINSSVYSYKGDIRTRKKEIKGSGKNIYSTSYENQILKFDISGNNTCDYLDYVISEDRVNDDWWHSLSNWYCENNSYVRIEFQKK